MSSEGIPMGNERHYVNPQFVQTVTETWENKRNFLQEDFSGKESPYTITYLYDGDPDGEDGKVVAYLWGSKMVVFGETLAMIELNLARLDATNTYGLMIAEEKAKEPTNIIPYLDEPGLLKSA